MCTSIIDDADDDDDDDDDDDCYHFNFSVLNIICRFLISKCLCIFVLGAGGGSAPTFRRTTISELTVIVSDTIKIPCKVQGDPTPFITWYYNGESISASTNER